LSFLAQDLSTVDGITIWGPLALTISIYVVPVLVDAARGEGEPRRDGDTAAAGRPHDGRGPGVLPQFIRVAEATGNI
jgi:hypothetical protein